MGDANTAPIEPRTQSPETPKKSDSSNEEDTTNITVYKDAALIQKIVKLPLESGCHIYKIDGIAETIDPSSLMLEIQSNSKSGQIKEYSLISNSNPQKQTNDEKSLEAVITTQQHDPQNRLSLLYLFKNLSWHIKYALKIDHPSETLSLIGMIEANNQSGIDLNNVKLHFIDSNEPVSVKESHLVNFEEKKTNQTVYSYPDRVSLEKNASKRLNWISSPAIRFQKQYRVYVGGQYLEDLYGKLTQPVVETWLVFSNTQKQGLGLHLLAGQVAIYTKGSNNNPESLGVADIPATAVDQDIHLKIPSGDIWTTVTLKTEMEQTEFKKLTDKATEANYRLCLKNTGNRPVSIQVVLDFPVNCTIIKTNKSHTVDSLRQYSWNIEIPPESEVDLKYRIQVDLS